MDPEIKYQNYEDILPIIFPPSTCHTLNKKLNTITYNKYEQEKLDTYITKKELSDFIDTMGYGQNFMILRKNSVIKCIKGLLSLTLEIFELTKEFNKNDIISSYIIQLPSIPIGKEDFLNSYCDKKQTFLTLI